MGSRSVICIQRACFLVSSKLSPRIGQSWEWQSLSSQQCLRGQDINNTENVLFLHQSGKALLFRRITTMASGSLMKPQTWQEHLLPPSRLQLSIRLLWLSQERRHMHIFSIEIMIPQMILRKWGRLVSFRDQSDSKCKNVFGLLSWKFATDLCSWTLKLGTMSVWAKE